MNDGFSAVDDPVGWLKDAACRNSDLELFFVNAGNSLSEEARQLCEGCPVRRECLMHAYALRATAGYFGGLSPSQRKGMTLDEALDFVADE